MQDEVAKPSGESKNDEHVSEIDAESVARDGAEDGKVGFPVKTEEKDGEGGDEGENRIIAKPDIIPDLAGSPGIHYTKSKEAEPAEEKSGEGGKIAGFRRDGLDTLQRSGDKTTETKIDEGVAVDATERVEDIEKVGLVIDSSLVSEEGGDKGQEMIEQGITKSDKGANYDEIDEGGAMMVVGDFKQREKDVETDEGAEIPEVIDAIFEAGERGGEAVGGKLVAMEQEEEGKRGAIPEESDEGEFESFPEVAL